MTTTTAAVPALAERHSARSASIAAFGALVRRDLTVLRKDLFSFLARTIMQPALLLFVFTFVFPKIGEGIGGSGAGGLVFSFVVLGGLLASATIFQGIQAVALPMVQDFGYTREIEDRVMAPMPVTALALQKVASGAVQGLIAAAIVFPLALLIPATNMKFYIDVPVLITVAPLAAILGASLGLAIGTRISPYQVGLVFSLIVLPMTFLGCVYYPWQALAKNLNWLRWLITVNPLVYMSEGFRAATVPATLPGVSPPVHIAHMPYWAIYGGMILFTAILMYAGVQGFKKRVLT